MRFKEKKLQNGNTEITCFDDDGIILEVRVFKKSTIDFLKQVDDNKKYKFTEGLWIPKPNK